MRHVNDLADNVASSAAKDHLAVRRVQFSLNHKAASDKSRATLSRVVAGAELWDKSFPRLSTIVDKWATVTPGVNTIT